MDDGWRAVMKDEAVCTKGVQKTPPSSPYVNCHRRTKLGKKADFNESDLKS